MKTSNASIDAACSGVKSLIFKLSKHSPMYLENSALFEDPNWDVIRLLAKLVAKEMGWSLTDPVKQKHRVVTG